MKGLNRCVGRLITHIERAGERCLRFGRSVREPGRGVRSICWAVKRLNRIVRKLNRCVGRLVTYMRGLGKGGRGEFDVSVRESGRCVSWSGRAVREEEDTV